MSVLKPGDLADRHPGTRSMIRWFQYAHLKGQVVRETSRLCAELAEQMVASLPDSAELSAGLRKLLEAKDCFVRAAIESGGQ